PPPVRVVQALCPECGTLAAEYNEIGSDINHYNRLVAQRRRDIYIQNEVIKDIWGEINAYGALAQTPEMRQKRADLMEELDVKYGEIERLQRKIAEHEAWLAQLRTQLQAKMAELMECENSCQSKVDKGETAIGDDGQRVLVVPGVKRPMTGACMKCSEIESEYNSVVGQMTAKRAAMQLQVARYQSTPEQRHLASQEHSRLMGEWNALDAQLPDISARLADCLKTCKEEDHVENTIAQCLTVSSTYVRYDWELSKPGSIAGIVMDYELSTVDQGIDVSLSCQQDPCDSRDDIILNNSTSNNFTFSSIGSTTGASEGIQLDSNTGTFTFTPEPFRAQSPVIPGNTGGEGIDILGGDQGTFTFGDAEIAGPPGNGIDLVNPGGGFANDPSFPPSGFPPAPGPGGDPFAPLNIDGLRGSDGIFLENPSGTFTFGDSAGSVLNVEGINGVGQVMPGFGNFPPGPGSVPGGGQITIIDFPGAGLRSTSPVPGTSSPGDSLFYGGDTWKSKNFTLNTGIRFESTVGSPGSQVPGVDESLRSIINDVNARALDEDFKNSRALGDILFGGDDTIRGSGPDPDFKPDAVDDIFGTGGKDTLRGTGSSDSLLGGPDSDFIPDAADDILSARGQDTLRGRADDTPFKWNNIAPRIGFAYDVKGDGQNVINSQYAMYEDRLPADVWRPSGSFLPCNPNEDVTDLSFADDLDVGSFGTAHFRGTCEGGASVSQDLFTGKPGFFITDPNTVLDLPSNCIDSFPGFPPNNPGLPPQSFPGTSRWGDYSSMTIDPVDDSIFWQSDEFPLDPDVPHCGSTVSPFDIDDSGIDLLYFGTEDRTVGLQWPPSETTASDPPQWNVAPGPLDDLTRFCPSGALVPARHGLLNLPARNKPALFNPPANKEMLPSDGYFHSKGSWGQGYDDQWALKRIGFSASARDADGSIWPESAKPVIVAVIDSGLDFAHPDLYGALWVNRYEIPNNGIDDDKNGFKDDFIGWNFIDDSNNTRDDNGHGTFVAGIIAAATDNERGIAGVNPWARIMPVKVTDFSNHGNAVDVAKGISYAARMGARIINVSIGGRTLTEIEQVAVRFAAKQGALVIVAAGNEGIDIGDYSPAGLEGVITVAASDHNDARAGFSNYGARIDITAPGIEILSLRAIQTDLIQFEDKKYKRGNNIIGKDRHYYYTSGTSFSAPFVSGAASLIMSNRPELSAEQVRRMIMHSARDIEEPGWDIATGHGLLDIKAALKADPEFDAVVKIGTIGAAPKGRKVVIQVNGTVSSTDFLGAGIEIAHSETPDKWKAVGERIYKPVINGVLAEIPSKEFRKKGKWSVRLLLSTRTHGTKEARGSLDIQ
ncbi:S8 family serine peptidase, partial [bacterium]|nr:S8 family serine peptidase [bacterium]